MVQLQFPAVVIPSSHDTETISSLTGQGLQVGDKVTITSRPTVNAAIVIEIIAR